MSIRLLAICLVIVGLACTLNGCASGESGPVVLPTTRTTSTTTASPTPPGTDTDVVSFAMSLENVDYDGLVANATLLEAFMQSVKQAVSSNAGAGISPEHVDVELVPDKTNRRLLAEFLSAAAPNGGRRMENTKNSTGVGMVVGVRPVDGAYDAVLKNLGSGDAVAQAVAKKVQETPGIALIAPRAPVPRLTRRPQRRAALLSYDCPAGATLSNFGRFAVLKYDNANSDLGKLSSGSYYTKTEGINKVRACLDHFFDLKEFDGEMVFPYQKLTSFNNYNRVLNGMNTNYNGELDDVERPFIMFNTLTENQYHGGASPPFLHEVMHTWGVGLSPLLEHNPNMPHGHWGITADDSHGYIGGFPREAFKCKTHIYDYWAEDTWTGNPDRCSGKQMKIDCEAGRTHHGGSEFHHDQAARAAGEEPTEEDMSLNKFSDFELLLMGARKPEDIQGDLIHCSSTDHLCESHNYIKDDLRCDSLEKDKPFGLLFPTAVDVRDVIIRDGGGSTRLTLASGASITGWKALENKDSLAMPTQAKKSWILYAISNGDLYAIEIEVRVASGNEAEGRGSSRAACMTPSGSPKASCSTYTCKSGWDPKPSQSSITCNGQWCEKEECCQPPATQPIVAEMKSLKFSSGFTGTAADVQAQFANMADSSSSGRFRGLRYHQVLQTTCSEVKIKSAQEVYNDYLKQEVKNQGFSENKTDFRFLTVVVKDPTDDCRADDNGLKEFDAYLMRSAARFETAARHHSADREARLEFDLNGKCKNGVSCDTAPKACDVLRTRTTTTITTTTTTTTTRATTTTTTTEFVCPVPTSQQGQSCTANSGDAVWAWMANNAFGLGEQYHGTVRPNMPDDMAPHGMCLTFGCVATWKYNGSGERATLQCQDGSWVVVHPSGFQQDATHKCLP